jgi:hypothetical protein
MWIERATTETTTHVKLLCDECGAIFNGGQEEDRTAHWREANIAGWARTARAPDRHACANC